MPPRRPPLGHRVPPARSSCPAPSRGTTCPRSRRLIRTAGWPTQQPAPGASGSRRGLATTAIILGALPLLGDLLQPFVLTSMVTSGGYAVYSMVALALSILSLLLGIGALVCGLIARRDAPLPAGIGIGLGTAVLVGGISSLLYGVIAIF